MRVLLVDDQALFREGLSALLQAHDIQIVGEGRNGREGFELAQKERPDLVLMDLAMPEMGGLAATRLIKAAAPEVRVVILTASEDDADLFEAIKSGAQGYILKSTKADELSR